MPDNVEEVTSSKLASNESHCAETEIHLESWDEFKRLIPDLYRRFYNRRVLDKKLGASEMRPILFRGQSDASWPIQSTLERSNRNVTTLSRYLHICRQAYPEIAAYTDQDWPSALDEQEPLPEDADEVSKMLRSNRPYLPCMEYMVYLRHHGFPSPLVDWTRSPFIAAWFAFTSAKQSKRVAVYAFLHSLTMTHRLGNSWLHVPDLRARTHPRYFRQQCECTVAVSRLGHEDHRLVGYDEFATRSRDLNVSENLIIKITLPANVRTDAMDYLDQHNINEFSLYGGEDAMVRSVAERLFRRDIDTIPADIYDRNVGWIMNKLGCDSSDSTSTPER
jgi:hypothetical protein